MKVFHFGSYKCVYCVLLCGVLFFGHGLLYDYSYCVPFFSFSFLVKLICIQSTMTVKTFRKFIRGHSFTPKSDTNR
jgi:hypothetical protein